MVKATKAEKKIAYDAKLCQLVDNGEQVKNPSKFAVAIAAVSADAGGSGAQAGAGKVEEKKQKVEESDEEDYGGFGLFDDE